MRSMVDAMDALKSSSDETAKIMRTMDEIAFQTNLLGEIGEQVRQLDQISKEVATASDEQSQGLLQINGAVSEIERATQANAAGSEEGAASAHELRAQAVDLSRAVDDLQALVGGTQTTVAVKPSAFDAQRVEPKPHRQPTASRARKVADVPDSAVPGPIAGARAGRLRVWGEAGMPAAE